MKKTPLYEMHRKLGGKMINFGGWELPIQYTSIMEEHQQVRTAAGLFDVSHMGEISIIGEDACKFIQRLMTNDVSNMKDEQVMYSPMCYPDGGVVDDVLIYKYSIQDYLLVVNASNAEKDFEWMNIQQDGSVEIINVSSQLSQLALQGPKAEVILQKLANTRLEKIKYYHFQQGVDLDGFKTMVSRTGYTGEDGFEIYLHPTEAPMLWEKLLEAGRGEGIVPAGLGARDTLRFEAALPLYGHEISQIISPIEAGLERFVKFNKEDFIGKSALVNDHKQGLSRKLVGFEMMDRGIPRSLYEVKSGDNAIGFVTTGSYSPTLKKSIGLALIKSEYAQVGTEITIIIKNKEVKAQVIKTPFYKRPIKKLSAFGRSLN